MRSRWILTLAATAAIVWLLWRFVAASDWKTAWQLVVGLRWWQIATILLLPFVGHFANALRWWFFLFALEAHRHVRLRQIFAYAVAGFSTGYLVPSADLSGKALRAVFIQRKGVPATDAVLSLSLELFFGTAIDTAVRVSVIFGFGFWWLFRGLDRTLLWAAPILGMLFVFSLIPLLPKTATHRLIPQAVRRLPYIEAFIRGLEASRFKLTALREKPAALTAIVTLSALLTVIVSAEIWLIARFLGSDAPFVFGLLFSTAFHLAGIFPVVGGAGVLENLMHEVFVMLGQPSSLATATVLTLRFKDFSWVLAGLIILAKNGISIFKTKNKP